PDQRLDEELYELGLAATLGASQDHEWIGLERDIVDDDQGAREPIACMSDSIADLSQHLALAGGAPQTIAAGQAQQRWFGVLARRRRQRPPAVISWSAGSIAGNSLEVLGCQIIPKLDVRFTIHDLRFTIGMARNRKSQIVNRKSRKSSKPDLGGIAHVQF